MPTTGVITKEQWAASDCLDKATLSSTSNIANHGVDVHYYLCSPCHQRIQDPSYDKLCDGAPRPPCPSMKEGETTALEIFDEFLKSVVPKKNCSKDDIESTIDLLKSSMSRDWDCFKCKYWETPRGGYEEAFLSTHSSSVNWGGNIRSFCTYFIIRKCLMSENEKRRCYTVMSKLVDFLCENNYISAQERKDSKSCLTTCRAIDADKIVRALQKLFVGGYWKTLEGQEEREPSVQAVDDEYPYDDDDFEDRVKSQLPMRVMEVTKEGWIFDTPFDDCGSYSNAKSRDRVLLVRLPEQVAKLGRAGMEISCLNLKFRRGIWSPYNPYDDSYVCANIYPP